MLSMLSVKKPYTVLVAVILVIVLGVVSFTGMSTDLLPSIELPYIIVMTTYPGASPEQVELTLTRPLESLLGTASGLNTISSVSRENSSMIFLEYSQSTNMDSAMIELSGSLDMISDQLPSDVGRPMMMRISPDMLPIMVASVNMEDQDLAGLSDIISDDIIPSFERINGVAAVSAEGLLEQRLQVTLLDEKIESLNQKVINDLEKTFSDKQGELEQAQTELAAGKAELDSELPVQQLQIAEASTQLNEAIVHIQSILAEETVLLAQQTAFEQEKAALDAAAEQIQSSLPDSLQDIGFQDLLDQPIETDEAGAMLEQVAQLVRRQAALEMELQNIAVRLMTLEAMKPELESGLAQSQSAYQELEQGKITLAIEMSQAITKIEQGQSELDKGMTEFETARAAALSQADLQNMINPDMIGQLIKAQNFSMPAGYLKDSDDPILVKVGAPYSSLSELENTLLFSLESIGDIRLSDIAEVRLVDQSEEIMTRINGQPGIVLTFQKQSIASTADVTSRINDQIDILENQNAGLQIIPLMDQGDYIRITISSVLQNLLWGGLLAILILMLFLKDARPTLVIAFSIPISLMFAITLMFFSNVTLNIVSLSGLALGVGMLVDNSIVVIENIYRLRHQGLATGKAAVQGARQMAGAIFASTLTTICVFLPIVFTEGIARDLFTDMGLTIAYSLLASLIVALSVVPALSATMLRANQEKKHLMFDAFSNSYSRLLQVSLRHKAVVLVGSLLLFALSLFGISIMGVAFIPDMDSPQMSLTLSLPDDQDTETNQSLIDEVSHRLLQIDAVEHVGALAGGFNFGGGSESEISYYILLRDDRELSNRDVERLIYEKTADINAEIVVSASTMDLSVLGGSGIQIVIKGNDLDVLAVTAEEIAALMAQVEGTSQIEWQGDDAETEIRVLVDKDEAMRRGLTVAQVFQEMSSLLRTDNQVTTISTDLDEWPVFIVNTRQALVTRQTLHAYALPFRDQQDQEQTVRLDHIAEISEAFSPTAIQRENQSRYITVSAQVKDGYNIGHVSQAISDQLTDYEQPAGYTLEMAGENEMIMESLSDLIMVMLLAILFIYLIMVAQFQNLLLPFIILFTIPLAFTGGLLLLWAAGFELSVIAMLGFLVLAGIVVNNGIVFISTVNQLRLDGMSKNDALITTGRMRIRPILMTALTTILAMSTLALGIGSGAEMTQPMAVVTIGGLSYATLLTLFVIPVMYDMLQRKPLKTIDIGDDDDV